MNFSDLVIPNFADLESPKPTNYEVMPNQNFSSQWLGTVPYLRGLSVQNETWKFVKNTNVPVILGLEHPSVITLGRRAAFEKEVLATNAELDERNIDCVKTDRGGQATLHSLGQLVIYPILPLNSLNLSVRNFICLMEISTKQTLESFEVKVQKVDGDPGLYSQYGKIAFFGFRIDRGVSRHGISINVSNDLDLFKTIRSCGKDKDTFDKIKPYKNIDINMVFATWLKFFDSNLLDLKEHLS